jgi:hypothetical protein
MQTQPQLSAGNYIKMRGCGHNNSYAKKQYCDAKKANKAGLL